MGIRVLIVDDHPVVCEGFSQLFEFVDGIDVVGTAGTGAEGLERMERLSPDLVLVDLSLPDFDGATLAAQMRKRHPDSRVVIFTGGADPGEVRRAVAAGVDEGHERFAGRDVEESSSPTRAAWRRDRPGKVI